MALPTEEPSLGIFDDVKAVYSIARIVAPTTVAITAEWGADVTWIENVQTGGSMRDTAWVKKMGHRNMRSISMNPSTEDGKETLRVTVKDADIFVESGKGFIYARKDTTGEFLQETNPKPVIVRVPGFEQWDDEEQINPAACDLTVAAYVGTIAQNGSADQPMNISPYPGDYINSLIIIPSALATSYRVGAIDEGESIDMATYETLLRVGTYYTTGYMSADILCPRPSARCQNLCGIGAYECKDGLAGLCLCGVSRNRYLLGTIGLDHLWGTEGHPEGTSALWLDGSKADFIQETLEEYLRTQFKPDARRDFVAYRIAAQVVNKFPDALAADRVKACECFIDPEKVDGTPVKVPNTFPKSHRNPGALWRPTPALGEDTRDVLRCAGYSDRDIDRLVESGTVKVRDED